MSARRLASLVALLLLLVASAALLGGCGKEEADEKDSPKGSERAAQSDDDAAGDKGSRNDEDKDDDDPKPTPAPDPVPEGELPPVQLTAPAPFQELVGSFILQGTAQVHEGAIAWAILDAKLRPMVTGRAQASCGAPCRGKFRIRIPLKGVPLGSWELHAWSPNVADEGAERLHDTMVPITVTDRRTPGAPAPGTIPPGGVPQ